MEIILRPSIIFPIVLPIVFLFILLQVSKNWSKGKYIRNFIMTVVTIAFLVFFFISVIQKTTIDINESGLNLKIKGYINLPLSWDDIKSVHYQKNYKDTGYKPTTPRAGSNFPGYNVGYFKLENKKLVYFVLTGFTDDAVVIETQKGFCILMSFKNLTETYEVILKYSNTERGIKKGLS